MTKPKTKKIALVAKIRETNLCAFCGNYFWIIRAFAKRLKYSAKRTHPRRKAARTGVEPVHQP